MPEDAEHVGGTVHPGKRKCASCGHVEPMPGDPWRCSECFHRNDDRDWVVSPTDALRARQKHRRGRESPPHLSQEEP
jgi:transposase